MLNFSYKKSTYILVVISLCILFTSCLKEKPVPQPLSMEQLCPLPESKIIREAMPEAKNMLSNPDCVSRFDTVFNHLISVAQNDPKPENVKLFSDFLEWAKNNSIISNRQSKEIYTQYFSHKFVALPRDYQTCSRCKDLDKIFREMNEELRLKDIGLMKICENKEKYVRAKSDHLNMQTVLKAVCKSCQSGE